MSYRTVSCEIDIDDFLSSCSEHDIRYIIKSLREDGHLEKEPEKITPDYNNWNNGLEKLKNRKHLITVEEENFINKIIDKLI